LIVRALKRREKSYSTAAYPTRRCGVSVFPFRLHIRPRIDRPYPGKKTMDVRFRHSGLCADPICIPAVKGKALHGGALRLGRHESKLKL
jgi:hypothetical protein